MTRVELHLDNDTIRLIDQFIVTHSAALKEPNTYWEMETQQANAIAELLRQFRDRPQTTVVLEDGDVVIAWSDGKAPKGSDYEVKKVLPEEQLAVCQLVSNGRPHMLAMSNKLDGCMILRNGEIFRATFPSTERES